MFKNVYIILIYSIISKSSFKPLNSSIFSFTLEFFTQLMLSSILLLTIYAGSVIVSIPTFTSALMTYALAQ